MSNNRAPVLDPRLTAAADLVRPGRPAADVGCDHGKLTAFLLCENRVPHVIATDLRPGPLAKAAETLRRCGCEDRAELRLGDGLSVLSPGEADSVIIAGVSAETAIQICEAAPWLKKQEGPRLIFVPATRHGRLRAWLAENGFCLAEDRPVQAAGRWYAVMAAEYTGEPRTLSVREAILGGTERYGAAGREYAAWQRAKLRKVRLGLAADDDQGRQIDAILAEEEGASL